MVGCLVIMARLLLLVPFQLENWLPRFSAYAHHHHYHFHSLSGSSSAGDSPFPSLGNNIILFSLFKLRAKSEANSINFLDLSINLQTCLIAFKNVQILQILDQANHQLP